MPSPQRCASTSRPSRISRASSKAPAAPHRMSSRAASSGGTKRSKTSELLSLAVGGVLILYPVLMYFGHAHLEARSMALILVALCAARLVVLRLASAARPAGSFGAAQMLAICIGAIALALLTLWRGSPRA